MSFVTSLMLRIHAPKHDMNDALENLHRVIRLIEEMDAYFTQLESRFSPLTASVLPTMV